MKPQIMAAGAVVWRKNSDDSISIALIHRPRYSDWSLPKGKAEVGEALISSAYREVLEETNLKIKIGPFIDQTQYFVPQGLKQVNFWSARAIGEDHPFHPNNEVDQMEWFSTAAAIEKVDRESDREILQKFIVSPFDSSAFIMLRHAKALARSEWQGDDDDRPLELTGQLQAKRMLSIFQVFGLEEIYTSDAVRCFDTVAALGKSLGIELRVVNQLSEYTFKKNKEKAIDFVKEVIKSNETILICSHNPVLPRMLEKLTKKVNVELPASKLLPGEAWVVHHRKKEVLQVDRLSAPNV
jgi:phosphohistidine phosphatase SixA/8-oxo-dGTP pyrophosphatase MutT (NUDIX family)